MATRREVLARLREIVRERRDLEQEARAILRENAAACTPYRVGDELIETRPDGKQRRWRVVEIGDLSLFLDWCPKPSDVKPSWTVKLKLIRKDGSLGKTQAQLGTSFDDRVVAYTKGWTDLSGSHWTRVAPGAKPVGGVLAFGA